MDNNIYYCINSENKYIRIDCVTAGIDIFLLLVLRNKLLKTIVNMSAYWVLGPIAQNNIMYNNDILNILKIVLYFTLIISFQILEYYTYKHFEMIE